MDNSKKGNITLFILMLFFGIVAGVILALAYYIPNLEWIKPFGYMALALWFYIAVRKLRKFVNKIIKDM